jgi:hypothetical protein
MLAHAEVLRFSIGCVRRTKDKPTTGCCGRLRGWLSSYSDGRKSKRESANEFGRGLRVTSPVPHTHQRSSYHLQLPYRYGLLLMTASALLHWLVSESFFLVRVTVFQPNGIEDSSALISTVGYSALTITVALAMMLFMLVVIALFGVLRRYDGSDMMPLVAGCSASLAAATQPGNAAMLRNQKFESGMELERLVWGVVGASTSNRESTGNSTDRIAGNDAERAFADGVLPGQGQGPRQDKPEVVLNMAEPGAGTEVQTKASPVGHATFSNKKVEMLVRGMSYS